MAKTVATRLVVLERRFVSVGCEMWRSWCPIVLGDEDGSRSRPERCPGCERVVPIRQVDVIVGVLIDAL